MNANTVSTGARAVALAAIVALAAVTGLIVGNAVQGRLGASTSQASFSLGAIQDLHMTRDNLVTLEPMDDYGVRQGVRQIDTVPYYHDYILRHTARPEISDTFRLTGPSRAATPTDINAATGFRLDGADRAPVVTDTYRLTGPTKPDKE
jgi:hypothetical protein